MPIASSCCLLLLQLVVKFYWAGKLHDAATFSPGTCGVTIHQGTDMVVDNIRTKEAKRCQSIARPALDGSLLAIPHTEAANCEDPRLLQLGDQKYKGHWGT